MRKISGAKARLDLIQVEVSRPFAPEIFLNQSEKISGANHRFNLIQVELNQSFHRFKKMYVIKSNELRKNKCQKILFEDATTGTKERC